MNNNSLSEIFNLVDASQAIFNNIMKEKFEYMNENIAAFRRRDGSEKNIEIPFQDRLENASDQKDAFSHMISVLEIKKVMLENKEDITEADVSGIREMSKDATSLTGIQTSISRTYSMFIELDKMLSGNNQLNDKDKAIAMRMKTGSSQLLQNLSKLQKHCASV